MSNKDRPGKSIAFYTDLETVAKLEKMAKEDHRSVSNELTVLIKHAWDMQFPPQISVSDNTNIYVSE
jgi:hypothetical protein